MNIVITIHGMFNDCYALQLNVHMSDEIYNSMYLYVFVRLYLTSCMSDEVYNSMYLYAGLFDLNH